jgi:tetratricopeptide (TPR) repeat protein
VTTGSVFCGVIGNQRRREYTMIGDPVNLSARLMTAAKTHREAQIHKIPILCDAPTAEAARDRVLFEALEPIIVKGKHQPVPVFVPRGRQMRVVTSASATEMVGREKERFIIAETLRKFTVSQSGVLIIEGEAGIGKSRLLDDLERQAHALSLITLEGAGEAVEQSTPYYAWRNILASLLDLKSAPESGLPRLVEKLSAVPNSVERAPLLAPVLSFSLPDNDLTAQMTGESRADNMQALIIELFKAVVRQSRYVLIFEDAHWLDSSSWSLLQTVSHEVDPLLLVLVHRPMGENAPLEYLELRAQGNTTFLSLQPLPLTEIEGLLCRRLGVSSLPDKMVEFILKKAEGHPFYSEELAYAMRDTGLIEIKNNECHLSTRAQRLDAIDFPTNIQGVITSRIDRLNPTQQFALKVASVVGRTFALRVLKDIYPIESDKPALSDHLNILERLDLTVRETPEPEIAYIFKHIITQEVAYNLLLFAQRRSLHHSVAQWYEKTYSQDLASYYPTLAYHWAKAEDLPRAVAYNEKSGEQALRNGAYREAINFFTEASALASRADTLDIKPLRRARWHRQIAEAYLGLGELDKSHEDLKTAVKILKEPAPETSITMAFSLIGQITLQMLHRNWSGLFIGRLKHKRDLVNEAAQSHAHLAKLHYFMNETLPTIYHTFKGLNLAEAGGSLSTALAWTMATTSAILGFIPLHKLAEQYGRRARAIAAQVDNPSAIVWAQLTTGVYQLGVGHWSQSRQSLEKAKSIAQRYSDFVQLGDSQVALASLSFLRGDYNQSQQEYSELLAISQRTGNLQQKTWAMDGQAINLIRIGRAREALASHEVNATLWETIKDITQQINHHSFVALGRWQTGDFAQAQKEAADILPVIFRTPAGIYSIGMGYFAIADMLFACWEERMANPQQDVISVAEVRKNAAHLNRIIRSYSRVFSIGRPGLWLNQGRFDWLSGRTNRAHSAWEKSIAIARELKMPYEEAKGLFELGRHSPDSTERETYLRAALEIFESLQAQYDIEQTRKWMSE